MFGGIPLKKFYSILYVILIVSFISILGYLSYDFVIRPYLSNKVLNETKDLFYKDDNDEDNINTDNHDENDTIVDNLNDIPNETDDTELDSTDTITEPKDSMGRLLQFHELLTVNEDIKGWLNIPKSNIDYPIVQSSDDDPEFYLTRNFLKDKDKAGTIFLDINSSVEDNTKNFVLHGHNMTSTDNMFHYLLEYNSIEYYKERPVIKFDTIYDKGDWKIFALIKTNGSSDTEPLFDYTRSVFLNDYDFLDFLYDIQIRSIYDYGIDLNEDDQIISLSTCSYEVDNYRTVIFARKIRENEDTSVDLTKIKVNKNPLYPSSWYKRYGGTPPSFSNFKDALANGEINWYTY